MRSVVIHPVDTTRDAVRERLSEFAGPANGDEWRYPLTASTPVLHIGFYEDYEREFEPDESRPLRTALGKMPDVIVIANVSGRSPEDTEVRQFVECLLGTFHGVAQDEYSGHCWTLAEIRTCATIQDHSFFDYEGWFRDSKRGAFMFIWFGDVILIGGAMFFATAGSILFGLGGQRQNAWMGVVIPPVLLLFGLGLVRFGRHLARDETRFLRNFLIRTLDAHAQEPSNGERIGLAG